MDNPQLNQLPFSETVPPIFLPTSPAPAGYMWILQPKLVKATPAGSLILPNISLEEAESRRPELKQALEHVFKQEVQLLSSVNTPNGLQVTFLVSNITELPINETVTISFADKQTNATLRQEVMLNLPDTPPLPTEEVTTVQLPRPSPNCKIPKVVPFEVWKNFGRFSGDVLRRLEEKEKRGTFRVVERDTSRDDDIEDLIDYY